MLNSVGWGMLCRKDEFEGHSLKTINMPQESKTTQNDNIFQQLLREHD